ncbi:MAG: polymerase sigma factor, sigma-70 family, partial [Verrucomicrobiales bacterium]|nr:polymerase sigma factor, sigma-70 family [Verrucomicrobiales bacterium]
MIPPRPSFMPETPFPASAGDLVRRSVAEFESMLTGYAYNLTGDLEMARDVVQDTFIKLYAQDPAKLDGGGLKPGLFTVCRNRALDLRRRRRRLVSLEDSPMDHLADPS